MRRLWVPSGLAIGTAGLGDMPIFDSGNPDHIPHVYEDWSGYSTIASIPSTNRNVDGGSPWSVVDNSFQTFVTGNNDPWFGTRSIQVDLTDSPAEGSAHNRAFNMVQSGPTSGHFLNPTTAKASIVVEFAFRMSGTDYAGKICDMQMQGTPQLWRHNLQLNHDDLGVRDNNGTDADPLCFAYYSSNGTVPRFAGLPPDSGRYGIQLVRAKNTDPVDYVAHLNQNLNWESAANGSNGKFDYDEFLNGSGQFCSNHMQDEVWRRLIIRHTLNAHSTDKGYGRYELWYQRSGGPVIKIARYYGDEGTSDPANGRVPGLVDWSPVGSHWINDGSTIHWFNLTGQNDPGPGGFYTGGCTVWLGYFRCWSHSRLSL